MKDFDIYSSNDLLVLQALEFLDFPRQKSRENPTRKASQRKGMSSDLTQRLTLLGCSYKLGRKGVCAKAGCFENGRLF